MSQGKQGSQASKMLLAARHFVIRISISDGSQRAKNVFARLQTREESVILDGFLGKPAAVSFYKSSKFTNRCFNRNEMG